MTYQINPLFKVDCYKLGHAFMYDPSMEYLESNLTARSHKRFKGSKHYDGKVVVMGVQAFVKEVLVDDFKKNFFDRDEAEVVAEYEDVMNGIFGEGVITVDHIIALHRLRYLPVFIEALPEGSRVKTGVPILRIGNTVRGFGWVVNYIETLASNYLWPIITTATIAFEFRRTLQKAAIETVGEADPFVVGYQGHDFSLRGLMGGMNGSVGLGHILSFIGSDNVPAIYAAKKLYNAQGYIAGSVPATEHSVASSNILNIAEKLKRDGESDGYKRDENIPLLEQAEQIFILKMITKTFPTGIFSYVSDTFDYWGVLTNILPRIKDDILNRADTNTPVPTRFVLRPDSGDVVEVICGLRIAPEDAVWNSSAMLDYDVVKQGDKYFRFRLEEVNMYGEFCGYDFFQDDEVPVCEVKGSIEVLWDLFGGTITAEGYKQLNSKIGLLYGDSINLQNLPEIIDRLKEKGFASPNVIFGLGSFTYQYNTRDTFGMAVKATFAQFAGEDGVYDVDLYKDPKTGDGEKKSAKGKLAVFKDADGEFYLKQQVTNEEQLTDQMKLYYDGNSLGCFGENLDEIRNRLLSTI